MNMSSRRAFLKALSFVGLVVAYPFRNLRGQTTGAGSVALPLDKLRFAWDSVAFIFGPGKVPGLAVRLPNKKLTVVSRICPHQKCFTDFITDPAQVLRETTYEPDGPVLVCPCHASVFDLSDGGKVLFGPAPGPPDHFKFATEGNTLVIIGLEENR